MTTATSNQLFATIIISFAFGLKIIVTMNLITIFKWLLNVYSYPNSPVPKSRIIAFKHSTQAFSATADQMGSYVRRLASDYLGTIEYLWTTWGLLWDYLGGSIALGLLHWVAPLGLLFSMKV